MVEGIPLAGLGALVGALLALTGAGGGAVAVPLLVLVAALPVQQASPVALVAVGLSAALGAAIGLRERVVRWRAALLLGGAGLLGAPLGVWLAQRLPQALLLAAFALFMFFTARRMWRPPEAASRQGVPPCLRPPGHEQIRWSWPCARVLARMGAGAGLLSGLLGVGGGFVIVPALDRHSNLDLRTIQATSLSVIALVSAGGIAAAAWHGQLRGAVAGPFALGAVAGLLAGRRVSARLSPVQLRRGFAVVAAGLGLAVLVRAAMLAAR